MTDDEGKLDTIYTEDEAAARLRITRRTAITLGKRYGCCSAYGRTVRFSEQDLLDLWQVLRVEAKEPRPVTVKAELPSASGVWLREYARKKRELHEERARLRKERETAARERRLEERRQAARARADTKAAKRAAVAAAKSEVKTAKHTDSETASQVETLDIRNRDPAYWTDERKHRLREEHIDRMKRWAPTVAADE
ncbi:hypothetical protein [Allomesorhizobium camelthorni]|uniref:Uncharacterized protein n=1 Tax=Allomesorhizobium camelthorni TaxID=475069 RepID=A0A6G4WHE0_9HYPH|nr:hypothetical protein [Mesorhizobium camelthorni]NGO54212.1 hypothetical protein [Mesorhizobium camelthorni]